MSPTPRIALFTDCFHEVNGVALTWRRIQEIVERRGYPFLNAHSGPRTTVSGRGPLVTVELERGPWSIGLESDFSFDPIFLRYRDRVLDTVTKFRPDLIHITGPGDCSILGAWIAWRLKRPMVASWHTNVHEFAARRLDKFTGFLPSDWARKVSRWAESATLEALIRFYRLPRVLLAPNTELVRMLQPRTGRPVFPMQRGIDTVLYDPARRRREDRAVVLGFVGRLSPEKNVRFLVRLEQELLRRGVSDFRFRIVGNGSERPYLETHLRQVEFTGVLRGEALAEAYAGMDLFVFPSHTDTFGNVVQEAMASGVPVVVTNSGGPKFLTRDGVTGVVAAGDDAFVSLTAELIGNHARRTAMGLAARQHALTLSWDSVVDQVYGAYQECLRLSGAAALESVGGLLSQAQRSSA